MSTQDAAAPDPLWTVAEVADHMRVSTMTVYRLIKANELPAVKVGKSYRIRSIDLQSYLTASLTVRELNKVEG